LAWVSVSTTSTATAAAMLKIVASLNNGRFVSINVPYDRA
jgi:hypothetical protein